MVPLSPALTAAHYQGPPHGQRQQPSAYALGGIYVGRQPSPTPGGGVAVGGAYGLTPGSPGGTYGIVGVDASMAPDPPVAGFYGASVGLCTLNQVDP
jgi:hypothetical protein